MKTLNTTLLIVLIFTSLSYSQHFASRGIIEIGGNVGFSSTTSVSNGNTANNSTTRFSLEPYVGYFLMPGLELGLIPSFSLSGYGNSSTTSFGFYFAPAWNFDLKSNFYPFVESRIGYNYSSQSDGNPSTEDPSYGGLAWGFRGGVKLKIGSNALLNLAISYEQMTMNRKGWTGERNGENIFAVETGFTVFFGR